MDWGPQAGPSPTYIVSGLPQPAVLVVLQSAFLEDVRVYVENRQYVMCLPISETTK